ncbi:protein phosphatase 1 regulatory subunit 12A isoform X2 [Scaptodrosophila lebanonensis]|uniref:Protein phosphatase 1 regulatory subunit 12B n=1 Tax=Drosophila lebanonensis TaxID=7225 RepID=A0A6J2TD98_DROLE|nr:protein phosphatase 1 regulatory subunit 12A isoform X2 [Scaptodrosophila lebanonensis]
MSTMDVRNNSAMMKRAEQLKRWEESDTNRAAATPRHETGRRIKFSSGCVFLAACLSSDKAEVLQLLDQGADINTANVDGLTALHQACIDDNLEMVEFLILHGADINRQDNEGWTPLHATASCGFVSIARYLVENGADVAAVNSDGDLAVDLAIDVEHRPMIDYMQKVVRELNIDVEQARKAEEQAMLNDAKKWLRSDASEMDRPHPKTGATALHVAAAKGYTNVLSLLLAGRGNVDRQDNDGWTALHAAAHWGQKETAEMLIESQADMDIRNYAGQSCIDVADRKMVKFLEELRANKRNKRRPSSQIRISDTFENHVDKTPTKLVRVEVRTDATKDADNLKTNSNQQIHATEHPVEEEAPWRRKTPRTPNDSPTKNQVPDKELTGKSSESNDVILRRTQSFENDQKFYQKYHELRARIKANSCPTLPASATNPGNNATTNTNSNNNNNLSSNNNNNNNNNNKSALQLGYAANNSANQYTTTTTTTTTTTSTTFNTTTTSNTNTANARATPAAAAATTTATTTNQSQIYSVQRSASLKDNSMYYRKPIATFGNATPTTPTTTATTLSSPSTAVHTPPVRSNTITTNTAPNNNGNSGNSASASDTELPKPKQSTGNIFKNFFKSFVPPVRDEESETQRKAHAKRVRETRRSTQGVTLDEIKSAEELVKKKNLGMNNNNNNNNNNSSGNETQATSSTSTTTTTTTSPTSTTTSNIINTQEPQPPPPPTTPPPAIIPTSSDETEIEAVSAISESADTTASFTIAAPARRQHDGDGDGVPHVVEPIIARENDDADREDDSETSNVVSASYTIVSRREKPAQETSSSSSNNNKLKTDEVAKNTEPETHAFALHLRPTELPLGTDATKTVTTTTPVGPTTPTALESPVRLRDKRSMSSAGNDADNRSDTGSLVSPMAGHSDFNARDSLLSYARRTEGSGGEGAGATIAPATTTAPAAATTTATAASSTSTAERRPSWRIKFDAGSKFKLEDNYPPNNSTIIPSAPAVIAAATTGSQRRISSGSNALNASNQSLNSVGRPVSAPSVGSQNENTNNSAFVLPPARKYDSSTTTATANTANSTATANTANSTAASAAASTVVGGPAATNASPDDKDNDKENDNRTQTAIQRRRKPKRRSTGVVHVDMDEIDPERQNESSNNDNEEKESGSERTSRSRLGSTTSTATTSASSESKTTSSDKTENGDGIDYKALWEAAKLENDKLKQMLKQKDDEVVQTRATLERFANATTKNSLSEIEKRERRAMERKLSELEEELKLLQKLKTENDRLRAENRALTRVVSKLTTSAQSQLAKTK